MEREVENINMGKVVVRFYGELNGFLPVGWRMRPVTLKLDTGQNVQDILSSIGVPFNRIDLILVNGKPAGFTCELQPCDRLTLYPEFRSIDITPLNLINRHRIH